MNARGVALIMGLILLAAISLLALTSARGMVLQHRMAGNLDENLEALHNASIAAADARVGGHVQDAARPAVLHALRHGARAQERPAQVHRHRVIPGLGRGLFDGAEEDDAGIVDHDVYPAPAGLCFCDHVVHGGAITHVRLLGNSGGTQFFGHLGCTLGVDVRDHHPTAFGYEFPRNASAEAGSGTRYDGRFVL